MTAIPYGAIATKIFGTALSASGDRSSAKAARQAAEYQARQLEVNAGQAEATAQLSGAEEARKSRLLQSRALALAAASGGSAVDPTVLKIISGLAGEGNLAARTRIHAGEEQARDLRNQASATRQSGENSAGAYKTRAAATVLSGAKGIYDSLNVGDDKGFVATNDDADPSDWWASAVSGGEY